MATINKQWIIKQLFYGTTATQFTYSTNNQLFLYMEIKSSN